MCKNVTVRVIYLVSPAADESVAVSKPSSRCLPQALPMSQDSRLNPYDYGIQVGPSDVTKATRPSTYYQVCDCTRQVLNTLQQDQLNEH